MIKPLKIILNNKIYLFFLFAATILSCSKNGLSVDELDKKFPGMKEKLVEGEKIKPGLAAVVGYVATRQGLRQKLEPDVEVHFVPAVSGG